MEFKAFYSRYKNIALRETRRIKVAASDLGVPLGEYELIDNYCIDDSCDCRKVMVNFVEVNPPHRILATIGYGWESLEFYTKWMYGDKEFAKELVGAYLEPGGFQSQYSQNFLQIFNIRLTDDYISTIKSHYRMFKKLK